MNSRDRYAFGVAAFGTLAVSAMTDALHDEVVEPGAVAQRLAGGGDALLTTVPASHRPGLGHTLHAAFATGHNTLALTAALACAALVLWLTRTGRRQHPAPQAPKPEQDTHSVD
ncbi:hypothetical protein [Streptomyces caelestis]|uniref:hypothetical protein n=1 Tax=Streptomyces caelestis TaxID=36816 RepID=UPI0036F5D54C